MTYWCVWCNTEFNVTFEVMGKHMRHCPKIPVTIKVKFK